MSGEAGKGSRRRPTDEERYRRNWERVFGHWRSWRRGRMFQKAVASLTEEEREVFLPVSQRRGRNG